jgi:hypothetical protein
MSPTIDHSMMIFTPAVRVTFKGQIGPSVTLTAKEFELLHR